MKRMMFAVVALIGATGCPQKTTVELTDDSIAAPRKAASTPAASAPAPTASASTATVSDFRLKKVDVPGGYVTVAQRRQDNQVCMGEGDQRQCVVDNGYATIVDNDRGAMTLREVVPVPTSTDDKPKARKRSKKAATTGSAETELKDAQEAKAKAEADLAACIADREVCKKETSVLRKEVDDLKAWRAKIEKERGAGTKVIVEPPKPPKGPGTRKPGTVHRIEVAPPGGAE